MNSSGSLSNAFMMSSVWTTYEFNQKDPANPWQSGHVKDRPFPGFNFFAAADLKLFEFLARGEHQIAGFYH